MKFKVNDTEPYVLIAIRRKSFDVRYVSRAFDSNQMCHYKAKSS